MQGNVSVVYKQRFLIFTLSKIEIFCYIRRKRCTAIAVNDPKSAVRGALCERIVVLSKFRIYDIWMRVHWSDSPFHIASILGILSDDWDILAPHSGLFDSCNTIKTELWGRKLQMEIDFRGFDAASSKGDRKRLLGPHLLIFRKLKPNALWRCVFRRNKYAGILAGPGLYFFF